MIFTSFESWIFADLNNTQGVGVCYLVTETFPYTLNTQKRNCFENKCSAITF